MPLIDNTYGLSEADLLRIPTAAGYIDYPLAQLLDFGGGPLRAVSNFGMPPIRFITQRGPFQDGETPLDMRLDPRVIQIEIVNYLCNRTSFWTHRNELIDLLRPNRAFGATYNPLIYRKFLPGGKPERGNDGISDGVDTLTSAFGRFIHYGGLQPGDRFQVSGTNYVVRAVPNDYTVILSGVPGAATQLAWRYWRNRTTRDLEVLLEQGPTFNEAVAAYRSPEGYREALRFVAHDPVWRGAEQSETWAIDAALGDLVFDGAGAWFGTTPGVGRWLFSTNYVGETIKIVYWGTWAAKPIFTITGPATNPVIENTTLGVRLELDYAVALNETVTIDTRLLTCTNNSNVNLLPYLTGDLATFALEGDPQAASLPGYPIGRVNNVTVNFSDGLLGASAAIMTWKNGYIAI
jgi:hypothetical protein